MYNSTYKKDELVVMDDQTDGMKEMNVPENAIFKVHEVCEPQDDIEYYILEYNGELYECYGYQILGIAEYVEP